MENKVLVRRLTFGSYVKLFLMVGLALSAVVIVLFILVAAIAPEATNANLYIGATTITFTPFTLGWFIYILIVIPFLSALFSVWFALISFLPFKLLVRIFKKLSFTALAVPPEPPIEPQPSAGTWYPQGGPGMQPPFNPMQNHQHGGPGPQPYDRQ